MTFRRFLDASEALLVEAYTSVPHVDLMSAINETNEYRMAGKPKEEPAQAVTNDASLAEFQQMTRGLK